MRQDVHGVEGQHSIEIVEQANSEQFELIPADEIDSSCCAVISGYCAGFTESVSNWGAMMLPFITAVGVTVAPKVSGVVVVAPMMIATMSSLQSGQRISDNERRISALEEILRNGVPNSHEDTLHNRGNSSGNSIV